MDAEPTTDDVTHAVASAARLLRYRVEEALRHGVPPREVLDVALEGWHPGLWHSLSTTQRFLINQALDRLTETRVERWSDHKEIRSA